MKLSTAYRPSASPPRDTVSAEGRAKGILAAMSYLSKRKGWWMEVDGQGARLKCSGWVSLDQSYSCRTEETLVEVMWGEVHFKDLTTKEI